MPLPTCMHAAFRLLVPKGDFLRNRVKPLHLGLEQSRFSPHPSPLPRKREHVLADV